MTTISNHENGAVCDTVKLILNVNDFKILESEAFTPAAHTIFTAKRSCCAVQNPDKQKLICETFPKSGAFMLASDSLVRPTLCELRVMRKHPKSGRFLSLYSTRFLASATAMQVAPVSMDALEAASKEHRTEQAFKISGGQAQADWRKAMGEEKMTWAQGWLDKEQMDKPANAYALISIPRLILIDREGRIVCSTNLPDEITEYLQKHITQ